MKIEIDTQRDSKEELKKLAKFLHELGDGVIPTNQGSGIFDNNSNSSNFNQSMINQNDNIFVITKHVGENTHLYYYKM